MQSKWLKPIPETKYLSVENAWRYRAIMRTFYINDLRYRHWLDKETVFNSLKGEERFSEYTLEMCAQDLEALHQWGNLSAVQDTSKVGTYQQFVNKQFRYQMTEYAIEIERMTVRLENLFIEGGSLEPTLMERLKEQLQRIPEQLHAEPGAVGGWWSALTNDFQRLNQSYQDYIRDWSGAKAEELMKTKHFLVYKEKLVEYLRHFIKALQQHGHEIEGILKKVPIGDKRALFERITDYESDVPRVDMETLKREDLYRNVEGKYQSIESFFMGSAAGQASELETILAMTNEIIRRITRYAATILEQSSQYSSRKEEYRTVAALFSGMGSVDDAHRLAAQVFGIAGYKHFAGDYTRGTESIQSSIYEEPPVEEVLTPRIRTYREKVEKTAIADHSREKAAMRERVLKERETEREILMRHLESGRIEMDGIGKVSASVRRSLLRWLTRAIAEKGGVAVTEHGQKYRLLNPREQRRCVLESEDGSLEMPAYILQFEE
ncbi:TIGR02677 family protein [Anaerotalea alkaliphila]|uniref:TIGR02677 family protein n=1 Tax=Anaerotalea alkaliphila TaxID=2662126 RepID=A0A7X5HUC0_9FIRM|nr:TIGR02677 family protein [Anaerotalea alkaliphila]NDL66789.1 TIGR02677 family protein [Anaerotalea alkaliphila]